MRWETRPPRGQWPTDRKTVDTKDLVSEVQYLGSPSRTKRSRGVTHWNLFRGGVVLGFPTGVGVPTILNFTLSRTFLQSSYDSTILHTILFVGIIMCNDGNTESQNPTPTNYTFSSGGFIETLPCPFTFDFPVVRYPQPSTDWKNFSWKKRLTVYCYLIPERGRVSTAEDSDIFIRRCFTKREEAKIQTEKVKGEERVYHQKDQIMDIFSSRYTNGTSSSRILKQLGK